MKTIVAVIFCLLVSSAKGQTIFDKKLDIGVGLNSGLPVGIFNSVYSLALGANVKAELPASQDFLVTFDAGYYQLLRKGGGQGIAFIPVLGGFKYSFAPKVFVGAKAGIAVPTFKNSTVVFEFVPEAGYRFSKAFQLSGNYTGLGQYGYVIGSLGIELAYYF